MAKGGIMGIARMILTLWVAGSTPVFAQEPERIWQLQNEVEVLKNKVLELNQRIDGLEQALKGKPPGSSSAPENAVTSPQLSTMDQPWHEAKNWSRIKLGMSEEQVKSILGPPTDAKRLSRVKTLYYQGDVRKSGLVSGNVQFIGDRVWLVNEPVF